MNLYWIKWALAFVNFLVSFFHIFLATCARLSWSLSLLSPRLKKTLLSYRIVEKRIRRSHGSRRLQWTVQLKASNTTLVSTPGSHGVVWRINDCNAVDIVIIVFAEFLSKIGGLAQYHQNTSTTAVQNSDAWLYRRRWVEARSWNWIFRWVGLG